MAAPITYSVDTSALMDGWVRNYPPTSFPRLWEHVDGLIAEGRFLLSEEVIEEVNGHDDSLKAWASERRDRIVVPTDGEVVSAVRAILSSHERLVMAGTGRNRADPFVIAVARVRSATVLTGEKGGSTHRPRIPSVCADLHIPCFGFLGLIQTEQWVFG